MYAIIISPGFNQKLSKPLQTGYYVLIFIGLIGPKFFSR